VQPPALDIAHRNETLRIEPGSTVVRPGGSPREANVTDIHPSKLAMR
jgi:hypothetical protein